MAARGGVGRAVVAVAVAGVNGRRSLFVHVGIRRALLPRGDLKFIFLLIVLALSKVVLENLFLHLVSLPIAVLFGHHLLVDNLAGLLLAVVVVREVVVEEVRRLLQGRRLVVARASGGQVEVLRLLGLCVVDHVGELRGVDGVGVYILNVLGQAGAGGRQDEDAVGNRELHC